MAVTLESEGDCNIRITINDTQLNFLPFAHYKVLVGYDKMIFNDFHVCVRAVAGVLARINIFFARSAPHKMRWYKRLHATYSRKYRMRPTCLSKTFNHHWGHRLFAKNRN